MEDQNDKRIRDKVDPRSIDKNDKSPPVAGDEGDALAPPRVPGNIIPADAGEEDGSQDVFTEEELRLQRYEEIDATEIFDDAETTPLYRRAAEDFDETETEVQLAEHFVFQDIEIKKHGYF